MRLGSGDVGGAGSTARAIRPRAYSRLVPTVSLMITGLLRPFVVTDALSDLGYTMIEAVNGAGGQSAERLSLTVKSFERSAVSLGERRRHHQPGLRVTN
jgi:hypothetical protein